MTRVTCTLYSTWCIMICLVILILSLLLFIQSLYSLSKLQFFPFTCITTVHPTFYLPPHFTSSPTTSLHLSHPPPHLPPPHFTSSPTTSPLPPTTSSLHLISHFTPSLHFSLSTPSPSHHSMYHPPPHLSLTTSLHALTSHLPPTFATSLQPQEWHVCQSNLPVINCSLCLCR